MGRVHGTFGPTDKSADYTATYESWCISFVMYPMPLVARVNRCWNQIKDWANVHFTEMLDSLVPGASNEQIEAAEKGLGFELPTSVRLLYHLCNGQKLEDEEEMYNELFPEFTNHSGLLGGYYFYEHFVNVHFLPLQQMVKLTRTIIPKLHLPPGSRRVVIAASCNSVKIFFLDCNDGQVYVGTRNLKKRGEMMPCTPSVGVGDNSKDGMLRWLEWYGHCLKTGVYDVRADRGIRGISLFPLKEPLCTEAITRGVQIQCSAVFTPELSQIDEGGDTDSYWFSYSVSMRLLTRDGQHNEFNLESAQLLARHWIIRPNGFATSEVRGEAVIGLYPLLKAGGENFVYQSCNSMKSRLGCVEGDFTFVPGRLTKPQGPEFAAYVARFPLEVPQYIF